MLRLLVALVITLSSVASSTGFAQEGVRVNLSALGLATTFGLLPVELDGRPGSEFLAMSNPLTKKWTVIYPSAPGGLCQAGEVEYGTPDAIADTDGDGKQEILRFDVATQDVLIIPFPECKN